MKRFSKLFIVSVGLLLLASSASAEMTIQLWTQEGGSDQSLQFIQKMTAAFEATHPDVKIEVVTKDNETIREDYQTSSLADKPPDLVWTVSDHAGPFTTAGLLQPVDELFDLSVYVDSALEAVQLDGETWGVPVSNGNHLMLMYNKEFVKEAPTNTDDLIAVAKELTTGDRYGLVWNQMEPFWLVPWLGGFGGSVFAEDGITPTLNTPEMIATLTFLHELKYTHKVIPIESDYAGAETLFKEKKAAMIVNGDWALGQYKEAFGENLGVARIPQVSATSLWPAPYTSGKFVMITRDLEPEKLEVAIELLTFMTNLENQVDMVKTLSRLPALKAALESEIIANDPLLKGSADQMVVGTPMPVVMEMRCNWDAMKPELNAVMSDAKTPEEAALAMQAAADACVKTFE